MYCLGSRGDRSLHWSADCWILQCCVDDRGLTTCYECPDFPCERLVAWAGQNASYAEGLPVDADVAAALHDVAGVIEDHRPAAYAPEAV